VVLVARGAELAPDDAGDRGGQDLVQVDFELDRQRGEARLSEGRRVKRLNGM